MNLPMKTFIPILVCSTLLCSCAILSNAKNSDSDAYVPLTPVKYADDSIKTVFFEKAMPEGNYDVTVTFGDAKEATVNWVKAEGRRYMLDRIVTKPGEFVTRTFTVNTRTTKLKDGKTVGMRGNEATFKRWDDKLTVSIMTDHPANIKEPLIKANPDAVTIFLAGDSTVTDQPDEPWATWGLMIPAFFKQGVAVANHGESGLTHATFRGQRRLQKVLENIKKGDYVMVQFGHNDQKEKGDGVGPYTTYKQRLIQFVDDVRAKGGNPVILTPVERRRFGNDGKPFKTLEDFAGACKQVATEKKVPLIDLSEMSFQMYGVFGKTDSTKLFVYYGSTKDDTHHCVFGGYELAKCIVQAIPKADPELAKLLRPGIPAFDYMHPDDPEAVKIPASSNRSMVKPAGN